MHTYKTTNNNTLKDAGPPNSSRQKTALGCVWLNALGSAENTQLYCFPEFFVGKAGRQKKRKFYGRADRKLYPPLWSAFCETFLVCFILDYDSMCSEMDLTPEKSFSSNYKNSQFLLTAAAALSQDGQIAV